MALARFKFFFLAAAVIQLDGSVLIRHMIEWFSTANGLLFIPGMRQSRLLPVFGVWSQSVGVGFWFIKKGHPCHMRCCGMHPHHMRRTRSAQRTGPRQVHELIINSGARAP
jgi:hypothetical protein